LAIASVAIAKTVAGNPYRQNGLLIQNQTGNNATFTRSDIGNISNVNLNGTSAARSYSDVHELTSIGEQTQIFDADGNLVTRNGGATLTWDDAGTDLMYYRARYYDPASGEFISQDPLEYVDGMSQYRAYFVPGMVDPNGTLGHIAGGALTGCAAGAGYSVVYSLFTGDSFCKGCCKAGVSCLFGALGGAMAAAAPTYAGCIFGVVSGITGSATKQVCNYACGTPDNTNITCAVATALINGALGCLIKAGAKAEPDTEKITKLLWTVVPRITGHDIGGICRQIIPNQPPIPVDRNAACKERCGKDFHWLLDRRLYLICDNSCDAKFPKK
jgi:RHS repeat-associated protein